MCTVLLPPGDNPIAVKYIIPYTYPDETAHGGTAVIIRQNIKHHVREGYKHDNLQATSISLEDNIGETTVSAIYCPPRQNNK